MKIKLTVIIPTLSNVNGLKYLLNYFRDKPYELIVIDNKKKNFGFAGGVNKGARNVKTKWMLVLNDDVEFSKNKKQDTIQRLMNFAEEKKLDAVTPVLRNPDGGIENLGYNLLPIGKIVLVKEFSIFNFQFSKIDGITAACLLIKTSVFKKLEGFDDSFFAYLEDVDFFLRFKKAGYKMGIADVEVLHNHMITAKTMGNFKARQDMFNWWRLYFKHPNKFELNLAFIIERLRNFSGFIKASLKI